MMKAPWKLRKALVCYAVIVFGFWPGHDCARKADGFALLHSLDGVFDFDGMSREADRGLQHVNTVGTVECHCQQDTQIKVPSTICTPTFIAKINEGLPRDTGEFCDLMLADASILGYRRECSKPIKLSFGFQLSRFSPSSHVFQLVRNLPSGGGACVSYISSDEVVRGHLVSFQRRSLTMIGIAGQNSRERPRVADISR